MKIKRILIANRGEIAVRIIYACKELGIESVAVYSEVDRDSLHVFLADQSICIGPAPSSQSYLNIPRIISAAEITGCDAIHPGYGFLSENAEFSEIVKSSGFIFIGPEPEHISKMGDKAMARKIMKEAGVPVIPGSEGVVESLDEALGVAREIGFPVILKASAGGGGKGMRVVKSEKDFEINFKTAQAEAKAAFGDGRLYIEKFIEKPKHIEVQVIGDGNGKVLTLFERECTIQRKHQKILEEAPSPSIDEKTRCKLMEFARKGAEAINYKSAGTLEFLMDENKNLYFIEMNTRIQVEHPITEFITGIDLIKTQIELEEKGKLELDQSAIEKRGHAIEVRINAENPDKGFMPSPGIIKTLHLPGGPGVRVDSFIYAGYEVKPFYDSLIAKLIVYERTRDAAIRRLKRALEETIIEGIHTTIPLHKKIIEDKDFIEGNFDTNFLEKFIKK
ncbi:MAG: acetyl-CoA carboxylase biotin carboxylase subunit [Candidatus Hydrothermales bacterium]